MKSMSSFGGRPCNGPSPNYIHAHAQGPAFSQQAGFFPSQPNGSGPRNNGRPGNSWQYQNARNRNNYNNNYYYYHRNHNQNYRQSQNHPSGRWDNNYHDPRRRHPRSRNGNGIQKYWIGDMDYNERVANSGQPRMPRSDNYHSPRQSHPDSHTNQAGQPFPPRGPARNQGGRRGRGRPRYQDKPIPVRASSPHPRFNQCASGHYVDRDGDVYMPDAPPPNFADLYYSLAHMSYTECIS